MFFSMMVFDMKSPIPVSLSGALVVKYGSNRGNSNSSTAKCKVTFCYPCNWTILQTYLPLLTNSFSPSPRRVPSGATCRYSV